MFSDSEFSQLISFLSSLAGKLKDGTIPVFTANQNCRTGCLYRPISEFQGPSAADSTRKLMHALCNPTSIPVGTELEHHSTAHAV
jgi:hypothetical protein